MTIDIPRPSPNCHNNLLEQNLVPRCGMLCWLGEGSFTDLGIQNYSKADIDNKQRHDLAAAWFYAKSCRMMMDDGPIAYSIKLMNLMATKVGWSTFRTE